MEVASWFFREGKGEIGWISGLGWWDDKMMLIWTILLLNSVQRNLNHNNPSETLKAKSSIDSWRQHIELEVARIHPWGEAFNDLQTYVRGEIRNLVSSNRIFLLRELVVVMRGLKQLVVVVRGEKGW
ncbi:Protein BPS1 chloroplastic [Bienertia sinuspersici]